MTIVGRVLRCRCRCHSNHDDTAWKYGVDSRDHIAAVMACDDCRVNHEAVLLDDEPRSRPLGDISTAWTDPVEPEGKE